MDRRQSDRRSAEASEIKIPDIMDVIGILYKHKYVVMSLILLPTFLVFFYLKAKPNVYRATTAVILESQTLNLTDFQDILSNAQFDNLTVPTQIEVISSPSLANRTIAELGLDLDDKNRLVRMHEADGSDTREISYDVLKTFLGDLNIDQQGTSRAVEISFKSHDPKLAAAIVNTHTRNYVMLQVDAKREQARKLNDWISNQIALKKEETLEKSKAIQEFKSKNGMVKGLNSEDLIYEQISDIVKQLSPIETRSLELAARVAQLNNGSQGEITETVESDLIQSLKSRASIETQELQSLRSKFGANHPRVIAARDEVWQIQSDIKREVNNIKRSIENELQTVEKQQYLLNTKLTELQKRADAFQEQKITLDALESEEAASRKTLNNFLSRSEELDSQIDFARPNASVISEATIPGEPLSSKNSLILAATLFLFSILALCVVFMIEIIDRGIQSRADVKNALHLQLLGTLPESEQNINDVLSKTRSPYLEEIKRLHIHLSTLKNVQTLLFTSVQVGEGKSLTALCLALYLNSIGKKTLIIDANTSVDNIAQLAGVKRAPGLYELLAGTHDIGAVIHKHKAGTDIIPAGEDISVSSDLIAAGRFNAPLEHLKTLYDYIIIDTASANNSSDAEMIAALSDRSVLVASWGSTKKKQIKSVANSLLHVTYKQPLVVLNNVPADILKNDKNA